MVLNVARLHHSIQAPNRRQVFASKIPMLDTGLVVVHYKHANEKLVAAQSLF